MSAKCRDWDPEIWFSNNRDETKFAIVICNTCPLIEARWRVHLKLAEDCEPCHVAHNLHRAALKAQRKAAA